MGQSGDTIAVHCGCGKKLKAPASAVGKKAKCPSCGSVVVIQAPPEVPEETYDFAEPERPKSAVGDSPVCPECNLPVPTNAVLCVNCGYNFKTGAKLSTSSASAGPKAIAPSGYPSRNSAKRDAADEKLPVPPWVWLFVVALVAIPVISLGGAIPGAIGCGGAGACFSVSRNGNLSTGARLGICAGITVGCWGLFILLVGAVVFSRLRS